MLATPTLQHRSLYLPAHTSLPGVRRAHNKRPGPVTPSRRRLALHSVASYDNDKHLAQLLRLGSPLTTQRKQRSR